MTSESKVWVFLIPCIIAAVAMMWFEKDGWGWLVFLALVTFVFPNVDKDLKCD